MQNKFTKIIKFSKSNVKIQTTKYTLLLLHGCYGYHNNANNHLLQ